MVDATSTATHPDATTSSPASRWVVGVDGSECSRHAALWAMAHAPGRVEEIELAATWSVPVSTAMGPMSSLSVSTSFDALEKSAHAVVDDLSVQLAPLSDVAITGTVGNGGAAALLLETAARSSMLVVGSRGQGGFARLVLGSTSTQCATHSTVPVAVIPVTADVSPATSIVVAFDGSANSTAALRWAVDFAAPDSTIDCVSVWDPTPIAVGADQFVLPDASGLARERYDYHFERSMQKKSRTDVDVRHHFVEGRARPALAERAADADLLVMGARGHGAIGAAVLGSVSTWLLHHVVRPMVVVPQPPGADGHDDVAMDETDRQQED